MKKTTYAAILASASLIGIAIGWLFSVLIVWIGQWLVNAVFETSYDYSIWLGGALFYFVWWIIKK